MCPLSSVRSNANLSKQSSSITAEDDEHKRQRILAVVKQQVRPDRSGGGLSPAKTEQRNVRRSRTANMKHRLVDTCKTSVGKFLSASFQFPVSAMNGSVAGAGVAYCVGTSTAEAGELGPMLFRPRGPVQELSYLLPNRADVGGRQAAAAAAA